MPMRSSIAAALIAFTTLSGCHQTNTPHAALTNAPQPLVTPTYEGSGQAMHPSVVYFPKAWSGYNYWMAVTPYPYNNARVENPSILTSNDGLHWVVPTALVNPVVQRMGAHLDDVDLLYESASGQLWLYYLEEDLSNRTHVLRRTSADGIHWSAPSEMFSVPNYGVISPAVQKTNNGYMMWYVNAGSIGCKASATSIEYRTSSDGVTWSAPSVANLAQPGHQIWHMEVRFIPAKQEYWALYAAYPKASCGDTTLYFATSKDGVNWQVSGSPILAKGRGWSDWDRAQIYRSTFLYDSDKDLFRVWYSAQRWHVWHTGYTEGIYSTVHSELHMHD